MKGDKKLEHSSISRLHLRMKKEFKMKETPNNKVIFKIMLVEHARLHMQTISLILPNDVNYIPTNPMFKMNTHASMICLSKSGK
jgi:hypothetical protein